MGFGDETTINLRDPTHTYLTSGIFNVELIAYSSDPSCNDTAFSTVTILDKPNPDFELSGIGVSTTGIDWLACANDEINFTDLTTIDGPISFESWFGILVTAERVLFKIQCTPIRKVGILL